MIMRDAIEERLSQVMLRQRKGVLPKGEIKYVEVMLNDDRRGDYI